MVYTDVTTIKSRIGYEGDDFYDAPNPDDDFTELLTQLERESRSLIDNEVAGPVTLGYSAGIEEEFLAPDVPTIQLRFPVDSVSKVEYKVNSSSDWETLDTDTYHYTKHNLILEKYPNTLRNIYVHRRGRNPLRHSSGRITWAMVARYIKITYSAGHDPIPENIKTIQINIINKMLRKLRQEQNFDMLDPEQAAQIASTQKLIDDDIADRISRISSIRNNVVVM